MDVVQVLSRPAAGADVVDAQQLIAEGHTQPLPALEQKAHIAAVPQREVQRVHRQLVADHVGVLVQIRRIALLAVEHAGDAVADTLQLQIPIAVAHGLKGQHHFVEVADLLVAGILPVVRSKVLLGQQRVVPVPRRRHVAAPRRPVGIEP